jgi:hypothetical protein
MTEENRRLIKWMAAHMQAAVDVAPSPSAALRKLTEYDFGWLAAAAFHSLQRRNEMPSDDSITAERLQ